MRSVSRAELAQLVRGCAENSNPQPLASRCTQVRFGLVLAGSMAPSWISSIAHVCVCPGADGGISLCSPTDLGTLERGTSCQGCPG